jgi:hypothetical protein
MVFWMGLFRPSLRKDSPTVKRILTVKTKISTVTNLLTFPTDRNFITVYGFLTVKPYVPTVKHSDF